MFSSCGGEFFRGLKVSTSSSKNDTINGNFISANTSHEMDKWISGWEHKKTTENVFFLCSSAFHHEMTTAKILCRSYQMLFLCFVSSSPSFPLVTDLSNSHTRKFHQSIKYTTTQSCLYFCFMLSSVESVEANTHHLVMLNIQKLCLTPLGSSRIVPFDNRQKQTRRCQWQILPPKCFHIFRFSQIAVKINFTIANPWNLFCV